MAVVAFQRQGRSDESESKEEAFCSTARPVMKSWLCSMETCSGSRRRNKLVTTIQGFIASLSRIKIYAIHLIAIRLTFSRFFGLTYHTGLPISVLSQPQSYRLLGALGWQPQRRLQLLVVSSRSSVGTVSH
jgi:hypothetical protein